MSYNAASPPRGTHLLRMLAVPLLMAATALLVGCTDDASRPVHEHQLGTITLTPTSVTLKVGENSTISTQLACVFGEPIAATLNWASSDVSVASVNASGQITAVALGSATVTASAEGKSAAVTVNVLPNGTSIGPAGGAAVSLDGNVELVIPAGALTTTTDVVIEPAAASMFVGDLLYIGGTGYQFKPDGLQLQAHAQLRIRFNPANVPAGVPVEQLRLRERSQDQWRETDQQQLLTAVVQGEIDRLGVCSVAILPNGTMIGAGGGTVTSQDGNAVLTIPAGVLTGLTDVVVAPAPAEAFAGDPGYVAGTGYVVAPANLALTKATLRIRYAAAQLPTGVVPDQLRLRERDQDQWRDTQQHQLTESNVQGEINGPGTFAVVVQPAGTLIGPAGGTVSSADGFAELVIPAGALTRFADLLIEPAAASIFGGDPNYIPGTGYLLKPDGLQLQTRGQLRIRFNPVLLPPNVATSQLRLRERDRVQNQWRDTEQQQLMTEKVQGEIDALGVFGIVVAPISGSIITSSGGTVTSADGNVELMIPEGALAEPTDVVITPVDAALFAGDPLYIASTGYRVQPDGVQLRVMAQLRIRYDPAHLPTGVFAEQLRLRERDRTQNQWHATQQHQMLNQRVQGMIGALGTFALVVQPAAGTMIGPAGGIARSTDGNVEMIVPASAVTAPTDFVITPAPVTNFGDDPTYIPGTGYMVNPDGMVLSSPVQLRIRYQPANVPPGVNADQLRLRERDRVQNQWRDTQQHQLLSQQVQGTIDHLGVYAITVRPIGSMVGVNGGTVTSSDGNVILTIPAGALTVPADVIIEKISDSNIPTLAAAAAASASADVYVNGTAYDIKPTGRPMAKPAGLSIKFEPGNVPAGVQPQQLRIRERDRVQNRWKDPSQCGTDQGRVTTSISEFGLFAILSPLPPTPGSVTLTPLATSIEEGEVIQLTAVVLDTDGNVMQAPVTWTSSSSALAVVDNDGTVTGVAVGDVTISATAGTAKGSSSVNVSRRTASVTIVPATATVFVGSMTQLAAEVRDVDGNLVTRTVTWATSAAAIATVNGGMVTGVAVGNAIITANVRDVSGTANIIVSPPVSSITISGSANEPLEIGLTRQLTAQAFANGVPVVVTFTWSSSDANIATVDATGLVTATGRGEANIVATVGSVSASVIVKVVGESTVTGNNLSLPVIFAEGIGITGLPVATDPGVRPTVTEAITIDTLPFWWSGNKPTYNTFFEQQTVNTWRPEIVDGTGHAAFNASVYWGDNLTAKSWSASKPIRVEQALTEVSLSLRGFNTLYLYGDGATEMYGADGTVGLFPPNIYTASATVIVEKLDGQDGGVVAEAVSTAAKAEVNVAGKAIYGYNLRLADWMPPTGVTRDGWYRITFQLETGSNVNITAVGNTEGTYLPVFSQKKSWIDIYVNP